MIFNKELTIQSEYDYLWLVVFRWWPARVLFPQEIQPNIMALPHKSWEFAVRFYGSNDHYWLNRGRVFLFQVSYRLAKGQTCFGG